MHAMATKIPQVVELLRRSATSPGHQHHSEQPEKINGRGDEHSKVINRNGRTRREQSQRDRTGQEEN
jgi:hypothetical protein